jgi:flagellum-specific ATP synthase
VNEPIADATRGVLDGHIWLSRKLANRAHYPAVDVTESISRIMPDVTDPEHVRAAQKVKRLLAIWEEIEDLVNVGAYAPGANAEFDLVIQMRPVVETFLNQKTDEGVDFQSARSELLALAEQIDKTAEKLESQSGRSAATPQQDRSKR